MQTDAAARLDESRRHLQSGDLAEAERLLTPLLAAPHPEVLHQMGLLRFRQGRDEEAVALLSRALALAPHHVAAQFGLGKVFTRLERWAEAAAAFRAVLAMKPGLVPAEAELARALHRLRQTDEAERLARAVLARDPAHVQAKQILAALLTEAKKRDEAEVLLGEALRDATEPRQKASLYANLAILQRLSNRGAEALANFEAAQALDPEMTGLDLHRAETLQDLKRYEESLALYRGLLAREPANVAIHNDYNDLLYRLGREEEYLKSFDVLPVAAPLQLAKAQLLMHGARAAEAHDVYAAILAREPSDKHAATGVATALSRLGRTDDAVAAFETLLNRHPGDPGLASLAAAALIRQGDAPRAVTLCEQALIAAPYDQGVLAIMGTALRVLGDERDEALNGYDSLIRAYDLEPPEGFSDMESFNAELCAYLGGVHPATREHISQTLRGGSQTSYNIFGAGHDLVDRLQRRIGETLTRYIADMKTDETHPYLSRRRRGFAYAGSWSSRLHDCGFHVNHIHTGWISSCYYAGVPDAVRDEKEKQGWIKFGEPDMEVGLSFRRAIQPAPGRLVLFPSYMWHGTVPFRSDHARMTIAFDAMPE